MHLQEVERIRCIVQWRNLKQIVFLLMSSYKFYVTADQRSISIEQRQPYQRHHLKQSLSPTTIVLSPGGITLVLPFFLFFQTPTEPSCSSTRETDGHGWIAQAPNKALPVVGKPRLLLRASHSSREKEAVSQVRRS